MQPEEVSLQDIVVKALEAEVVMLEAESVPKEVEVISVEQETVASAAKQLFAKRSKDISKRVLSFIVQNTQKLITAFIIYKYYYLLRITNF